MSTTADMPALVKERPEHLALTPEQLADSVDITPRAP
jgi:hypothetical protein